MNTDNRLTASGERTRTSPAVLLALTLLTSAGCMQQMANQPAYRPLRPTTFFPDGRSSRPPVPGTVARGQLRADIPFYTGKKPGANTGWAQAATVVTVPNALLVGAAALAKGDQSLVAAYVDTFPFSEDKLPALLQRGQLRFDAYCSMCHDRVGTGDGMIVRRGFTRPPNFHKDLSRGFKLRGVEVPLREAPVGYYFDVISNGFGAMASYASQVPPEDRWAIVAYIRALQLSQHARLDDVQDETTRRELLRERGLQP